MALRRMQATISEAPADESFVPGAAERWTAWPVPARRRPQADEDLVTVQDRKHHFKLKALP